MNRLAILIILVLLSLTTKSQTVVSGKVTDTDGQPLARVSVMVEGTEIHTVTNDDNPCTYACKAILWSLTKFSCPLTTP